MPQEPNIAPAGRILAIGGGKGGAGKSVVTAALGQALAQRGKRCILVDADFGGANLHTLCGVATPALNLRDFLRRRVSTLAGVIQPTVTPGLGLISGADAFLDGANLPHAQKQKLIRHLATLEADFVLLDLGAGTSYNVVDLFLAAGEGVLVVQPTPTSVENAYQFLRASFYRLFQGAVRRQRLGATVDEILRQGCHAGLRSPRDLLGRVAAADADAGGRLAEEMQRLRLRVLVNQVVRSEERELGGQMAAACRDYFGLSLDDLGCIPRDDRVLEALRARRPVLEVFPRSSFALAIHDLALRILGWQEARRDVHVVV